MFIQVQTFEQNVSNPYYDGTNSNIEPRTISEYVTKVTYHKTEEALVSAIRSNIQKSSEFRYWKAEEIHPKFTTIVSL